MIGSDKDTQDAWVKELATAVRLTIAPDLEEAKHILDHEAAFAVIAIDAFAQGETLNAIPLITDLRIRRGYKRPIIGIASSYPLQLRLINAGCTVFATKREAPDKIMEALKLNLWRT